MEYRKKGKRRRNELSKYTNVRIAKCGWVNWQGMIFSNAHILLCGNSNNSIISKTNVTVGQSYSLRQPPQLPTEHLHHVVCQFFLPSKGFSTPLTTQSIVVAFQHITVIHSSRMSVPHASAPTSFFWFWKGKAHSHALDRLATRRRQKSMK